MKIANDVTELIGNTPGIFTQPDKWQLAKVAAKLEYFNPAHR